MERVILKMVDNKTIGISTLITLGLVLAGIITPSFFEEPKYYCEYESSIMSCEGGLSSGSQTRCYLNTDKTSWDYCRSGWLLINNDMNLQDNNTNGNPSDDNSGVAKELCSRDGCISLKE